MGLFIISLTTMLEWSNTELFSYTVVNKLEARNKLSTMAVKLVQAKYHHIQAMKDPKITKDKEKQLIRKYRYYMNPFLSALKYFRGDNKQDGLETIKGNVRELQEDMKDVKAALMHMRENIVKRTRRANTIKFTKSSTLIKDGDTISVMKNYDSQCNSPTLDRDSLKPIRREAVIFE